MKVKMITTLVDEEGRVHISVWNFGDTHPDQIAHHLLDMLEWPMTDCEIIREFEE